MENPIKLFFKSMLLVVALIFLVILIRSTYSELENNHNKTSTFNDYELVTINKDTIRGNFFFKKNSSFFVENNGYYILLRDSTRYNEKNIVSIKQNKIFNKK